MWKKQDSDNASPPLASSPSAPAPLPSRKDSQAQPSRGAATIGPSIVIKGDVSGQEDLIIEGTVEGEVSLRKHNVTVGRTGKAKADIYGKNIRVEGEVRGNLFGEEAVVIHETGSVAGNITAPRVSLENGSTFKGSIDMGASVDSGQPGAGSKHKVGHPGKASGNKPGAQL
ncbi:MAG: polymer-forming cytoskeletal protein [Deltaproteobacteria bacterium]|nr:polymer-forming cytoskeletal protein [Deltaproteobacteria bacterium]